MATLNAAGRPIKTKIPGTVTVDSKRKRGTPPKTFPPCRVQVRPVREVGESGHPVAPHYVVHLRSYPRLSFGEEQHGVDECHDGRRTLDVCASWLSMVTNVVRNLKSQYRLRAVSV